MAAPPVWKTYRSRSLLTIDRPPIDNGWIAVVDGSVVEVGRGRAPSTADDLGDVALMPGLVNAHTHLELCELAGQVPPADAMVPWIRSMVAVRGRGSDASNPAAVAAAREAMARMAADGTVLVGDISNSLMTAPLFDPSASAGEAGLAAVIFHELIGFNRPDPADDVRAAWARVDDAVPPLLRPSVVAHAPYSVSPTLFGAIAAATRGAPLTVHLGESRAELEFLATGRGPFRELLEMFGVWTDAWTPPACDPAEYLDRLGYLRPGTLVVHGTHLDVAALTRLREREAVLVTCPRSNVYVGEGAPPISAFYASGVPVAIGTDSLASSPSLRMWEEMAAVQRAAPEVQPRQILESATRIGADALGWSADFGTIAPGKRAALVAVDLRGHAGDVEEYLVSGVPADAVRSLRF